MNVMRKTFLLCAAAVMATACSDSPPEDTASEVYSPDQYSVAIRDIARSDDVEQDESRKPGELLAFAEIDRGDVVGDYIMGGGYVTKLLAIAAGADGKVYAFQPEEFIAFNPDYGPQQEDTVRRYADQDGTPIHVFPLRGALTDPGWPEQLDTIITVMNFHDLWLDQFPEGTAEQAVANLFDALKPGGSLIVVDHLAADGGGIEAANTLHRMDRDLALETLQAAGFELEAESDMYARPADPRSANIFDDAIRGRTDQFAWRLRKPE